jgi:non-ribosomal peptide synthase protein (TIGR01720 family)
VYLVTGGLGGVGLALAEHLAVAVRAKLVLLGRTALPARADWERWIAVHGESHEVSRKILRLEALEAHGAEILVLAVDVADREQVERAVAQARARFGVIHGVIHAAGQPPQGLMQLKTPEAVAAVMGPKVAGTRNLASALADAELDLFVLCSSLGSLLGEPGRADYVAANAFLDAWAVGAAPERAALTLSIGWDGWREVGMGARQAPETDADREALLEAMATDEGVEAFRRALTAPLPHVLVSVRDFAARREENRSVTAELALRPMEGARASRAAHHRPPLAVPYAAPEGAVDKALGEIWQDVLGIDGIGIDDNFFELGGDSLVGLQIVGRASQAGLRLSAAQIFEHPTVRGLAAVATAAVASTVPQAASGPVPLTPVQEWFFEQAFPAPHHWNQSQLLEVRQNMEPPWLAASVGELVRRHDALRLRFEQTPEGWRQQAAEPGEPPFVLFDLSALPVPVRGKALSRAAEMFQESLDLESGHLLRVVLFAMGPEAADRLLFVAHHLAVDVLSWQILFDDLQAVYRRLATGGRPLPAPTGTPFTLWAERLRRHVAGGAVDREIAYWTAERQTQVLPSWPVDSAGGANTVSSARTVSLVLTEKETTVLLRQVPAVLHAHPNDVLLAALCRVFAAQTGSSTLRVEIEGHGREGFSADVDPTRTVGWFTAAYPVVFDLTGADEPEAAVTRVRDELRGVPGRGFGYGLLRHLSPDPEIREKLGALPAAEIQLAYLGEVDQGLPQESAFHPASEAAGPVSDPRGPRTHLFQVAAAVLSGRLALTWIFSANLHGTETVQPLIEGMVREVRAVLALCGAARPVPAPVLDFPEARLAPEELDRLVAAHSEMGEDVADVYPLSPLQEGILFHTLSAPGSGVYVTQTVWTLRGALDPAALRQAWQTVLDRHPALRTCFVWEGYSRPVQVVLQPVETVWEELDWTGMPGVEVESRQRELVEGDRLRGFDPARAPLSRLTLVRLDVGVHKLLWTFHHLVLDGQSTRIVLQEVFSLFVAGSRGSAAQLPAAPLYRDFIAWLGRQGPAHEEIYWRRLLAGFTVPTSLRLDRLRGQPPSQPDLHRKWQLHLGDQVAEKIQSLARGNQLTLNTVSHGAWALLLGWHSGQRDVVYGAVLAGRPPEVMGSDVMVGLFINTLPVRMRLPAAAPLLDWLRETQLALARLREHEQSPLVRVQGWSEIPRGVPLFEHALIFDGAGDTPGSNAGRLGLDIEESGGADQNSLALTLTVRPGFLLDFEYDPRRFGAEAIRAMGEGFAALLDQFVARPETTLGELWDRLEALDGERAAREPGRSESAFRKLKSIKPTAVMLPPDLSRVEAEAMLPEE